MTGKKTRTAAISAFDSGLSRPNQLFRSGANAMIGTAFAATASGRRIPRAVVQRAVARAAATPATVPITRPMRASWSVLIAAGWSAKRPLDQLSRSAAKIADGLGIRNDLTLRA